MQKKLEKSGLSEEELLKMQQELFAKSRSAVTKANQEANNNTTSVSTPVIRSIVDIESVQDISWTLDSSDLILSQNWTAYL